MDLKFPLEIDSAGRLVTVDSHDETKQLIYICLNTHQGDWDFDVTYGIPWMALMSTKPVDLGAWRGAIVQQLSQINGVDSIDELTVEETANRNGLVSGSVTSSGVSIAIEG